jgi:uncharacterized protein
MKQSNYNFFFQLDSGEFLAFNSLRNGLAVIDANTVNKICVHAPGTKPDFDSSALQQLKRGGFLCDDDYDEYRLLTVRRHMRQYANTSLGLTIAPTLNCNLRCLYCFENPDTTVMSENVIKKLVEFVSHYIKKGIKSFSTTWYGGEPLMCFEEIQTLSNELIALCKKNKVEYSAALITNGTLLDKDTVMKLKRMKVGYVQITLDGPREIHDKRRPFRNPGRGSSFDTIMANLKEAAGKIPIALRINLDVTNKEQALDFVSSLTNRKWFSKRLQGPNAISPYYGYVKKYTKSCGCSKDDILNPGDFWEKDLELKRYFYKNFKGYEYYPNLSFGCLATNIQAFVVDAGGKLYKCWNHLGFTEKSCGNIFEPLELQPLSINYLTESFESDKECKECKVLPICMGGCVDVRVKTKTGEFDAKDCASWKYYLEETIRDYYINKMQQKKDSAAKSSAHDSKSADVSKSA